jgi:hypothetical protein
VGGESIDAGRGAFHDSRRSIWLVALYVLSFFAEIPERA